MPLRLKSRGRARRGPRSSFFDRATESREEIAARIAAEKGSIVVPSYDDPHIVAGQGTVGLEILDQLKEVGTGPPARILVNCGGGGLTSGIALACPDADVIPVEPEGWDDMLRSLELGEIVPVRSQSAADALRRDPDATGVADNLRHPSRAGS
jgi:threonine dehydratase